MKIFVVYVVDPSHLRRYSSFNDGDHVIPVYGAKEALPVSEILIMICADFYSSNVHMGV